jgi:predicted house-cleaning noncanonical NTP pyrophosphatase (MazG superfamily)
MPLPEKGKLVRDRIPHIIRESGRQPQIVTIGEDAIRTALEMKLSEEVAELLAAPDGARLEELADIYELLLALAREIDVSEQQLREAALAKRTTRGSFDKRSWLVDT